ncbi:MAG: metallopeptidase family protein [Candidatus Omnitrophica bacterium]|nr:metallopeptidase family protein [Candidatus Omnitrophota bacterium]
MALDWNRAASVAQAEVEAVIKAFPKPLRVAAGQLPITCERRPNQALLAEGIEPDTLGLFVGESFPAEGASSDLPVPAQIILFLENLWEFTQGDEAAFRAEIRTTLLHELGHYLGLNEIDLEDRGLE